MDERARNILNPYTGFEGRQLRYAERYHRERNHRGLANRLIDMTVHATDGKGETVRESKLGAPEPLQEGGMSAVRVLGSYENFLNPDPPTDFAAEPIR